MGEQGLAICNMIETAPLNSSGHVDFRVAEIFCSDIKRIESLFFVFTEFPPMQLSQFITGHETELFLFASHMIKIIESPRAPQFLKRELKELHGSLALIAGILHMMLEVLDLEIPPGALHPAVSAIMEKSDAEPFVIIAWDLIQYSQGAQLCFAIGCTKSLQTVGATYKVCRDCRTIGYCNTICQKHGWMDKCGLHKEVCKKIKMVIQAGGSNGLMLTKEAELQFVEGIMRAQISDYTLTEVWTWLSNMWKLMTSGDHLTPLYDKQGCIIDGYVQNLLKFPLGPLTITPALV